MRTYKPGDKVKFNANVNRSDYYLGKIATVLAVDEEGSGQYKVEYVHVNGSLQVSWAPERMLDPLVPPPVNNKD